MTPVALYSVFVPRLACPAGNAWMDRAVECILFPGSYEG